MHYNFHEFDDSCGQLLKDLYMQQLGLTDENTLDAFETYKLSEIQRGCKDGMTIESNWDFNQRKYKERQEGKKHRIKEAREKKKEEMQKRFEREEGPMPTRRQTEAFKLALKKII